MKFNKILLLLTLLSITALQACKQTKTADNHPKESNKTLKHAELFSIDSTSDEFTKVTVYNPWDNQSIHSIYYLTRNKETQTPEDGLRVEIPLQEIVTTSATQVGFLSLLDELNKIKGITDINYVYNPYLLEQYRNKNIQDLGESFNINTEKLLMLNPEVIFTTAFNGDQSEGDKMKRLNQKPIYNIEWQEKSLLGRAEWIKFMGAFFDKNEMADSIFNDIEANYNQAKQIVANVEQKPTILSGQDFRGTWSLPSGSSYAAQLFKDAKVDYHYKNDSTYQGSIPSSIEEALVYFHDADLWINVQAKSIEELEKENSKYKLFIAFKNKNVYNNNKRSNPVGGNDYWESGIARPDLLLKDLIKIAHPTLLEDYELTYTEKLN